MKKNTLIFGGTKGIGLVVAKYLKLRGDNIIHFSRNVSENKKNIKIDLSNELSIANSLKKINYIKKIDNIIFSQRYRGVDWREDFQVSVFSIDQILKILINKISNKGSIVLVGSVSNRAIIHDQELSYHLTKSSLEQMTKFYAVRLGKKKIRFNCVLPAKLIKPENENFFKKEIRGKKIYKLISKITPLNKMGDSSDIAKIIEFLTNDNSSFLTGLSIPVDGGAMLQSPESIASLLK
jgi:3-oxoacyl-[acyl-carrier protein] reductase